MRAFTYDNYGEPDVLNISDVPDPKVPPATALVRVRAVSVNPVDWKIMQGYLDPMMDIEFPVIPGWDVAGVVEAVGFDTPEVSVGDEVMAYARKDTVRYGTFAELVAVPARTLAKKPKNLSWDEAAGLPLAGLTALQLLDRLAVEADDIVLIHGGSGGVGLLATQIARHRGARVIATASAPTHDQLRALGAEPVTYGEGVAARIKELAPYGVTAVIDLVGEALDITREVLSVKSRHASVADQSVEGDGGDYVWVRPDAADLAALGKLAKDGHLTIPITEVFPFDRAADAFRLSQEGHAHGKIIVRVSE